MVHRDEQFERLWNSDKRVLVLISAAHKDRLFPPDIRSRSCSEPRSGDSS
jgi:hypothetical protein